MAPLAEMLATLRKLLAPGAGLSAVRFEDAAFRRAVVEKELQAVHQTDQMPEPSALYRAVIDALATAEERERLAALAAASDSPAAKLASELLRSPLGAVDNPILKLIFAAQYAELAAQRAALQATED